MSASKEDVIRRNNVRISGTGPTIVFAHGYGCDQNMWRYVAPAFAKDHQVVLFDYVGAGDSDLTAYHSEKYATLHGYAQDVLDIYEVLGLKETIFVGHSVSSMIGVLAAIKRRELFQKLILVGPSPRYLNDDGYTGGFSNADIEGLLSALDSNYLGWSAAVAPAIMGNADSPELGAELTNSFCRTDPKIAKNFARATFLSDNRKDLRNVSVPTLILQCEDDIIAPKEVGNFVHQEIANSTLVQMKATGHCPNLSAPEETTSLIKAYLALE